MFSRAIGTLRCYSPRKVTSILWVKCNEGPSTQVSIKKCINMDDFAKKVGQKLNTRYQVALFTSLDKKPLDPGFSLNELLKSNLLINTSKGILFSGDTLYLLEAKHNITNEKLQEIAKRVNQFPKMIETLSQNVFNGNYGKIVGVACGTRFPDSCLEEAHRLGLMIVYPSGSRYRVE